MKFSLTILTVLILAGCTMESEKAVVTPQIDEETLKAEVLERVNEWDRTWAELKDIEKLKEFFHDNIVSITPSDREIQYGKTRNLELYQGVMDGLEVVSWELVEPVVDIYNEGRTAVLSTCYKIVVKGDSENIVLEGRDLMTLIKEDDKWVIVADQFSPFPEKERIAFSVILKP